MRRVILTFSGKVPQSEGSQIWKRVAGVMERAGANIETAGSCFVRMQRSKDAQDNPDNNAFLMSVSAFGAHIEPSRPDEGTEELEDVLGCTMYIKAQLPGPRIGLMMKLLETQSPLEVYTVSTARPSGVGGGGGSGSSLNSPWLRAESYLHEGGAAPSGGDALPPPGVATPGADGGWAPAPAVGRKVNRVTGTLYLFGVDRPGQLAVITEMLRQQRLTVLHLRVQSGGADLEKCDFVQASGGPLAENRIRIVFDEAAVDLAALRAEIEGIGRQIGYAVTCLVTDVESQLRAWLPSYLLRRKAFTVAYAVARAEQEAAARQPRRRCRPPASVRRGHSRRTA